MDIIQEIAFYLSFFGTPAAALIAFVVSLIVFLRTDKSSPKRRNRKVVLIISGCIAGVTVSALIALIILTMIALSHM